uniref:thioredoxin-dependent peroxiredoxin n=1 Tax=Wuchereria bancrofti TaxID=6293 RepID=A0AAF5PHX5_WUCBA
MHWVHFNHSASAENNVPIGLFLIDPSGEIRHSLVNDLPVGRSVDEAFRTLKAFQFVEKHGEVCPANWSDDKPTIKPGVKESKEYFKKVDGHI